MPQPLESAIAGSWYPGTEAEEAAELKGWMHMLKNVNISRMVDA